MKYIKIGLFVSILVSFMPAALASITTLNMDDKQSGDALSSFEFNEILTIIRDFHRDDNGTPEDYTDDKIGIAVLAPAYKFDIAGSLRAHSFTGDGSGLTNLPSNIWAQSGSTINYALGNVGIGVAVPDEDLHVLGNVKAADFIKADGSPLTGAWTEALGEVYRSTGNIGIGLVDPDTQLHLYSNVNPHLKLENPDSGDLATLTLQNGSQQWDITLETSDRLTFRDETTAQTLLVLESGTGNVGIGLSDDNPATDLHIGGEVGIEGRLGVGTASPAEKMQIVGGSDATLTGGGYLIIGATSALVFDNNEIMAKSGTNASDLHLQADGGDIVIHNNELDSEKVIITSTGNLGLGITTPSYKLDIDGNAQADSFIETSDRRLKKNIKNLENSDKILELQAVEYDLKKNGNHDIGVIAQDLELLFPEMVHTNNLGIKGVDYAKIVVPLLEVVKDQQQRIEALEKALKK